MEVECRLIWSHLECSLLAFSVVFKVFCFVFVLWERYEFLGTCCRPIRGWSGELIGSGTSFSEPAAALCRGCFLLFVAFFCDGLSF